MRSVVVLPQPDGPSSEKNSAALDLERDVVDRDDVVEALREPDQPDVVVGRDRGRGRFGGLGAQCSRAHASARTSPRIPVISSNSACVATSGGEIWITGSPRSSALQIRPFSNSRGDEEAAQERLALLVGERLARLLVLHELERVEEAGPAHVADDRQVEQLLERLRGTRPRCRGRAP